MENKDIDFQSETKNSDILVENTISVLTETKPIKHEPLDIMFYQKPYNVYRRAKIILFSSCLLEHEKYATLTRENKNNLLKKIEKACCQYCIMKANEYNIPTKWNNDLFKELYHSVCAKISSNITQLGTVKNKYLTGAILDGSIDIDKLPGMTSQELYPDKYKELLIKLEESKKVARTIKTSSMYKCRRCHKNECTEENRYNRSLDEGVNLTITCMSCGYRWNA